MALVHSDDETMLVDTVKGFLARSAPVTAFRALRDAGDPKRYAPALWAEMCEMGLAGVFLPEDRGGSGFGYAAAGFVAEQIGHVLAASPFLSTALTADILHRVDGRESELADLVSGQASYAFAVDERARHAPHAIDASADGLVLNGAKRLVADGNAASAFIVAAKREGRTVLLWVPRDVSGVTVTSLDLLDVRDWADIRFDGVGLPDSAVLAEGEAAEALIARALDLGRALLAAEMLGIAQEAFNRTVEYLKDREQFGVKIGTFQALQHRASRLYIALEVLRSTVFKALRALDEDGQDRSDLASLAKLYATRTARDMLNEAIQLHGGIGVTDELDIGLFFKRVRVIGDIFGDDNFQKARLAAGRFGL